MSNDKKKPLGFVLASLMIFVATFAFFGKKYAVQYISGEDNSDLNSTLMKTASQINKKLPMMVDSETRLDSSVGMNRAFRYNYTLVNFTAEELDPNELKELLEERLINSVCTTKEMEVFTKNDVSITYAYHGKNGKQVTTITVLPEQCKS